MARRLRSIGVMAIITLMALFTLLPVAGAAPRAATQTVNAKDFEFDPKSITINVGDTITWKNVGAAPHTAQADDGSFNSGNLAAGAEYSFTFNTAGTFPYFCLYHGAAGGAGMSGTVVVQEAAAAQPTAAPAAATPTGSVDVSDQPLAEGGITVAKVTAGQDGWIVAHLDEADKPGKVLGQTAVKAGDNNNVKIALSESVPAGGKLWPMLHIDAGALGTYEFPGPDVPVIVGGNIVMKQITVTGGAAQPAQPAAQDAVEADNQAVANNGITVRRVVASQDGWIVAHLDEGGQPGKVIGQTAVKRGTNNNVVIALSESVPVGGKLWPMLHIDAGTIGTYEFPGPDAPVIIGGNIIMKQISVTAGGPATLPRTGGVETSAGLLLVALALLAAGALLIPRARRRA